MKQFNVRRFLQENKNQFTTLSDAIWEVPELHFEEVESCRLTKLAMQEAGFEVIENVGGLSTALMGSYGSGKHIIAFIGEYDALPNLSQEADVSHFSPIEVNGNGHGCGHNLLGVGAFAAACAVKEYIDEMGADATVRYYACPAEENGSGKAYMVKEGVFDSVDIVLSWHPMDVNTVFNVGTLANYSVKFKFTGISSHAAASPHLGRSALDAVELMNVGANYLREHVIQDARIHYAVTNSGGTSPNVVQPYAEVFYLIRAPKKKEVLDIYKRVQNIAKGAALMTGTSFEEEFQGATANLIQNSVLNEVMNHIALESEYDNYTEEELKFAEEIYNTLDQRTQEAAYENLSPEHKMKLGNRKFNYHVVPITSEKMMYGSTDVSDVSWVKPTVQFGGATWALGTVFHSWQVVAQGKSSLAHKGMLFTSEVLAKTAIECIENPAIIEKATSELETRLNGEVYKSLIPN